MFDSSKMFDLIVITVYDFQAYLLQELNHEKNHSFLKHLNHSKLNNIIFKSYKWTIEAGLGWYFCYMIGYNKLLSNEISWKLILTRNARIHICDLFSSSNRSTFWQTYILLYTTQKNFNLKNITDIKIQTEIL